VGSPRRPQTATVIARRTRRAARKSSERRPHAQTDPSVALTGDGFVLRRGPAGADIKLDEQRSATGSTRRTKVTDEELAEMAESTLERCSPLGALLVADDKILHRLLAHLGIEVAP
jgi:hypothetical protein